MDESLENSYVAFRAELVTESIQSQAKDTKHEHLLIYFIFRTQCKQEMEAHLKNFKSFKTRKVVVVSRIERWFIS